MFVSRTVGCAKWLSGYRGSGSGDEFTRRILSARSGFVNLLIHSTSRVWLTDTIIIVLLSISVRWRFRAEKAIFTGRTCGVHDCVSRRFCPLAGVAWPVGNTDINFYLSSGVRWSCRAESAFLTGRTCGVLYSGSRGLCPLPDVAHLVGKTDITFLLSISVRWRF